jgi:hypothetical protein
MHDPAKLEAGQIAAPAPVLHGNQGKQLFHQGVAEAPRDPMGFAVGTPRLPKHLGITT